MAARLFGIMRASLLACSYIIQLKTWLRNFATGYGNRSEEELLNDLKVSQDKCLSSGITSGQDVIVANPRDIRIYKELADKGELKMRMNLLLYINDEEQARQYVQQIKGYKSDMLTFGLETGYRWGFGTWNRIDV